MLTTISQQTTIEMKFHSLNIFLSLLFVTLLIVQCVTENQDNLIAVFAYTRHGHRAPFESFPKDKYFTKTYWPMGIGQLTQDGIRGQYKLGQWFRNHYNDFLSELYSPDDIYIYSTNQDRTLMSAYAILAGLYPPKGFQIWNDQLLWQPIPVHADARPKDDIFVRGLPCKKFDRIFEVVKEAITKEFETKHAGLIEYVRNQTGWEEMDLILLKTVRSIFYTYGYINSSFIPEWAHNLDQPLMDYLSAVVYEIPTNTTEMARLRIGLFFNYIIKYFESFIKPSSEIRQKFQIISGHDSSMISILDAMGAFNMVPVKYDEATIWELRRGRDGHYFLNVLFKGEKELRKLRVHNCDLDCYYDEFKKKMAPISITSKEWKEECNSKSSRPSAFLGVSFVGFLTIFWLWWN